MQKFKWEVSDYTMKWITQIDKNAFTLQYAYQLNIEKCIYMYMHK